MWWVFTTVGIDMMLGIGLLRRGAQNIEIVLVRGKPGQQLLPVADGQGNVDPGMDAAEFAQPPGNIVFRGGYHGHAQPAPHHAVQFGQPHVQPFHLSQYLAGGGKNHPPGLGQIQPLPDPLDQRRADLILNLAHLGKDRGLGQVQLLGSAGIGQVPRHGGKDLQLAKAGDQ
jgi:hypothetical protein